MKLQMKREALEKINRQANKMPLGAGSDPQMVTVQKPILAQFWHS